MVHKIITTASNNINIIYVKAFLSFQMTRSLTLRPTVPQYSSSGSWNNWGWTSEQWVYYRIDLLYGVLLKSFDADSLCQDIIYLPDLQYGRILRRELLKWWGACQSPELRWSRNTDSAPASWSKSKTNKELFISLLASRFYYIFQPSKVSVAFDFCSILSNVIYHKLWRKN